MRIYGLKSCDTCKKARKVFPDAIFQDVREEPLGADFISAQLAALGSALVNTRSTTWRGLSDADRAEPPLTLLQAHPTLMKRPLIEKDGVFHLGWTKDVQAALGG